MLLFICYVWAATPILFRESTFISFCDNGTLLRAFFCFDMILGFGELLRAPPEPKDATLLEFLSGLFS